MIKPLFTLLTALFLGGGMAHSAESAPIIQAGVAVRDITPTRPIFLAGYAARDKPSVGIDTKLKVQALALKSHDRRFVMVALDNCEVSGKFMKPVLVELEKKCDLPKGSVMVVSSHTHSAPMLVDTLEVMSLMPQPDQEVIRHYSGILRSKLVEVVLAALEDLQPAILDHAVGEAQFAMNRRVYHPKGVQFGENPIGPVDRDVPVLRISNADGRLRCILFGYACHATSIQGNGFYTVTGEYMAYAREHLEALYPGSVAMFLTGMGADINPSPRSGLLDAKRHGLELAGAVVEILNRPMRRVRGSMDFAYRELELAFEPMPSRSQLEADANHDQIYIRRRAQKFLDLLDEGKEIPQSVALPMSVVRIGEDLTFVALAGEVVVDYALQFKRLFHANHPWLIGYAYEVPCYIPSIRILREGGYEAESSLIYYGFYGPFTTEIEPNIMNAMTALMESLKASPSD